MEAAVAGVFVLCPAGRAHGEDAHRRFFAVVGNVLHDGEARAAVGAVDERVVITPVGGIEQFAQAVIAGGGIGRDERAAFLPFLAVADGKGVIVARRYQLYCHGIDARQGRRLFSQRPLEAVERLVSALDLDDHTLAIVQHESDKAPAPRLSIDERPEANALHNALHNDAAPLNCRSRCG